MFRNKRTILMVLVLTLALFVAPANADYTFGTPTNLGPTVNSSSTEDSPCISSDGLSLYFQSNEMLGSLGSWDLWVTTRETINDPWGKPVNLGSTVNSSTWDFEPSITANGLELYFNSRRPGGYGGTDGWVTTRASVSEPWGEPVNLGPVLNSSGIDQVEISFDGLTAIINSNRQGGYGGWDLWISTRPTLTDAWSEPVNLGPEVNGSAWEMDTALSADNRFLFFTAQQSAGGLGGDDLWLTTRATINDAWSTPVNLGPEINSSNDDYGPGISFDGSTLYFGSDRPGSDVYDLWQAPIIPIVDFNGDENIDTDDLLIMIDNWGTSESLCDIGPMPWGDGVIDIEDLKVFMEYWEKENMP